MPKMSQTAFKPILSKSPLTKTSRAHRQNAKTK